LHDAITSSVRVRGHRRPLPFASRGYAASAACVHRELPVRGRCGCSVKGQTNPIVELPRRLPLNVLLVPVGAAERADAEFIAAARTAARGYGGRDALGAPTMQCR
jgi:hypothetical protein